VQHFLNFHLLFTSGAHSWVKFAGSHLRKAGKNHLFCRKMGIFIATVVTEFGKNNLFLLRVQQAGLLQALSDDVTKQPSVLPAPEVTSSGTFIVSFPSS